MNEAIMITIIVFVSLAAIVLGPVWMGLSYAAKKRGLTKGLTNRELEQVQHDICLLYTSPSPRDGLLSRMPSSA